MGEWGEGGKMMELSSSGFEWLGCFCLFCLLSLMRYIFQLRANGYECQERGESLGEECHCPLGPFFLRCEQRL